MPPIIGLWYAAPDRAKSQCHMTTIDRDTALYPARAWAASRVSAAWQAVLLAECWPKARGAWPAESACLPRICC